MATPARKAYLDKRKKLQAQIQIEAEIHYLKDTLTDLAELETQGIDGVRSELANLQPYLDRIRKLGEIVRTYNLHLAETSYREALDPNVVKEHFEKRLQECKERLQAFSP